MPSPIEITNSALTALHTLALPEGVKVRLYAPAMYPRQFLELLRIYMLEDGALSDVFWWQQPVPDDEKGGPEAFCRYFEGVVLLVVFADDLAPMGMVWFSDVLPGQQADMSVWYRRRYWGREIRAISRECLHWAFVHFRLQRAWSMTIFPGAAVHALASGGVLHATVPDRLWYKGQLWPVYVHRATLTSVEEARHGQR